MVLTLNFKTKLENSTHPPNKHHLFRVQLGLRKYPLAELNVSEFINLSAKKRILLAPKID